MLSHLKEVAICGQFDYFGQMDENVKDAWFDHFLDGDLAIKISSEKEYLVFYDYLSKNNVNLVLWKRDIREYNPFFSYFFMNNKNGYRSLSLMKFSRVSLLEYCFFPGVVYMNLSPSTLNALNLSLTFILVFIPY